MVAHGFDEYGRPVHPVHRFLFFASKRLFRLLYKVEVVGYEHIPKEGGVVLASNHVSYVDGAILHAISKRPFRFVIHEDIYRLPGVHFFMRNSRAIPIAGYRQAVKRALHAIETGVSAGDAICLFPEGRITFSGHLGRFRFGIEWIVNETQADVVPIIIDGLWGSMWGRRDIGKWYRFFPKAIRPTVRVVIGAPIPAERLKINLLQKRMMFLQREAKLLRYEDEFNSKK